jgi:hypothetical protein
MSKLVKFVAMIVLIGGALAVTPRSAEARWGYGGVYNFGGLPHIGGVHFGPNYFGRHFGGFRYRGGPYRRGYGGWGGFGAGPAIMLGLGAPYYYADWPYYARPGCGWARVSNWGHRYRVWRCW